MHLKEQYEIVSGPNQFHILNRKKIIADVRVFLTDKDIQHVEVQTPDQVYLKSEFDISMTRVPGLSRSLYYYDQEVAQFIYQNMFSYVCKTWMENIYSFMISSTAIEVFDEKKHVKIAEITKIIHNNHIYITFEECIYQPLKLVIALFPCLRFI